MALVENAATQYLRRGGWELHDELGRQRFVKCLKCGHEVTIDLLTPRTVPTVCPACAERDAALAYDPSNA